MGSFFPVFTVFSSISERVKRTKKGSEKTVELSLLFSAFWGPLLLQEQPSHVQLPVVTRLNYQQFHQQSLPNNIFHQQMQSSASMMIFFDQQLLISLL